MYLVKRSDLKPSNELITSVCCRKNQEEVLELLDSIFVLFQPLKMEGKMSSLNNDTLRDALVNSLKNNHFKVFKLLISQRSDSVRFLQDHTFLDSLIKVYKTAILQCSEDKKNLFKATNNSRNNATKIPPSESEVERDHKKCLEEIFKH